jgi:hypothetical protein
MGCDRVHESLPTRGFRDLHHQTPAPQLVLLVDVLRERSFGARAVERERRDEFEDFSAAFAFLTWD